MPLFRYSAIAVNSKKTEGLLEADSLDAAKEKLRRQKLLVTKVFLDEEEKNTFSLPPVLLLSFSQDLYNLLKAGLPLYESLVVIEEKYRGMKAHFLFLKLCEAVKQGRSLSSAMAKYPKAFDAVYVSMVAAGEETGNLTLIFHQLSVLISRAQKIKKQTFTALIYPGFLLAFCVLVVFALFFFVIPSMEELFEGRKLHPMTQSVLSLSHFFHENGKLFLLLFSLFTVSTILLVKSKKGISFLKRMLLNIPLIKTLMTESVLARFCRVLSVLLQSSVPLLKALPLSRKVMNHPSFEEVILRTEKTLIEGKSLSSELKNSPLIPKMMVRMLSISEEMGEISPMLLHVADIYEENLEKSLTRFTNLLQPILLLILGLIVGTILLSVLLPLTDVSSFLEQ